MARQRRWDWRFYVLLATVFTSALVGLWALADCGCPSAFSAKTTQLPPPPADKLLASTLATDDQASDVPETRRTGPIILTSANGPDGVPPGDIASAKTTDTTGSTAPSLLPKLPEETVDGPLPSLGNPSGAASESQFPILEKRENAAAGKDKVAPARNDAVGPRVVALPEWSNRVPETVASVPSPLHWDLFADIPASLTAATAANSAAQPTVVKRQSQEPSVEPSRPTAPVSRQLKTHAAALALDDSWQEPTTLLQHLRELSSDATTATWASSVLRQVQALGRAMGARSPQSEAILRQLGQLSHNAAAMAAKTPETPLSNRLRRTGFALERRVEVWQKLLRLHRTPLIPDSTNHLDRERLVKCLAKLNAATGNSPEGRAWRKYLLVEQIEEALPRRSRVESTQMRRTAQRALARITEVPLSAEQQQFMSSAPVVAFRDELRHWAAEPIGAAVLLRDIERYEATELQSDARRLARNCQYLLESPIAARRQLASCVEHRYCEANFRMAVTAELLNSLIPERDVEYRQISDTVQGRPTSGHSLMAAETTVETIPDPKRVRIALVVKGEIQSKTLTDANAAKFVSQSQAYYIARKPLEIDMKGLTLWPAEVEVHNNTQLRGVDTKLGNVPVIGFIAGTVAERQYEQNREAANREVEQKIIDEASRRIDAEARQQMAGAVAKLNQHVFDPLNNLALGPELKDAETTERRFTMRYRVGGEDQVGGHTPRPQAPSDSLASVQLHESALHNGLRRLQLEGRTFTLPRLAQHVASSLNCSPWHVSPDNEDVKISFAPQDAVVVHCREGRIMLTFSVQRLSKGPHHWNNFQVRAFYRPEVHERSAALVRDGVIQLPTRLSTGSQIALRGIFSHALSKKTPFELIPQTIVNCPKLKDTSITQFVIEDGWLGLALGPKRSEPRSASSPTAPRG